jgi:tripartite-type tricarboxylate transporter receptor subunit TctC
MKRRAAIAASLAMLGLPCAAQSLPTRPITLVVPSGPGALSDILARLVADHVSRSLGVTIVVVPRPGGSGTIGSAAVMRAQPDGATLLLGNGAAQGVAPFLMPATPYDPLAEFTPIARVGETQLALVTSLRLPVSNAQELIAHARSNPGTLTFGSFGHGSAGHLLGEVLNKENGVDLLHVPYTNEAAAAQALMQGQVDVGILVSAKPLVEQRQARLIGITGPDGSRAFPGWPTLSSQGVKGFDRARGFQAILGPAGMPEALVRRLASAVALALKDTSLRQRLLDLGVDPADEDPVEFPALYRSLVEGWQFIVRRSGVTLS